MAATQPTLEPDIEPNRSEDDTVANASEPRTPPTLDSAHSTRRRAMPPRPMTSPAKMKSGTASSGKLSRPPNKATCTGAIEPMFMATMPIDAAAISATKIGTPRQSRTTGRPIRTRAAIERGPYNVFCRNGVIASGNGGLLPPPLGGRAGEGGRCCCARCVRQLLPPPPTPPHKGEGSAPNAWLLLCLEPNGLRRGHGSKPSAHTKPPRGTLPPRHPCEITGNLGLRGERSRPHRLYV